MKTMIALIKRETWEHRSFWLVPAVMGALLILGSAYSMFYLLPVHSSFAHFVSKMTVDSDPDLLDKMGSSAVVGASAPFFVMAVFIILFYLLDSLYSERKDRSILFWKSLPVSDIETVASKWLTVLLVVPGIAIAAGIVLSLIMTSFVSLVVMFGGGSAWELVWSHYSLFGGIWEVLLAYVTELLWYLPLFGWLMLASAWAKKAPFLWAVLPVAAVGILEAMIFESSNVLTFIGQRLQPFVPSGVTMESAPAVVMNRHGMHLRGALSNFDLHSMLEVFSSAGFWGGLLFALACTAGAIWLRRFRDES